MSDAHVTSYIWRGLKYTFTSLCAILAGYLMQSPHISLNDILVILIPISTSVFFFICYANTFFSKESTELQKKFEKEAVRIFPLIEVPVLIIIILLLPRNGSLPWKVLISFGIYGFLYVAYGMFLLKYEQRDPLPLIRHQLVWPVVLSIGIGLYFGLSFSTLSHSFVPLLPVAFILALYLAAGLFHWSKRSFVRRTLFISFAVTIITVLDQMNLINIPEPVIASFSLVLFCIAASAYLAVFESWLITANVAEVESATGQNQNTIRENRKSTQYAIATFLALVVSVWALPFYFIFSNYGTLFLFGFAFHAFGAFVFWFLYGRTRYLTTFRWGLIKAVAGLLFLGLLVAVTFLRRQFSFPFMTGFSSVGGLAFAFALTIYPGTKLLLEVSKTPNKKSALFLIRLLLDRINGVRLLCVLCFVMCFITYGLVHSLPPPLSFRAELAFDTYWACVFLCSLVNFLDRIKLLPSMVFTLRSIAGFLVSIRVLTSFVIGLVVILPALSKGIDFWQATLAALPFFFAAAGGFALNDYCDVYKDSINKPYRAIPSAKLTENKVLGIAVVFIGVAGGLAVVASTTWFELVLYSACIAGVSIYNLFVKHVTPSKNFLTAAISSLPLLYVVVVLAYPTIYLLIPVAACLFLLGREWLMDIRDVPGDSLSGVKTLPMIIGDELVATLSFLLLTLSSLVLLPLALKNTSAMSSSLVVIIALSVSSLAMLWRYGPVKLRRAIVIALWIPMGCGILMLVS